MRRRHSGLRPTFLGRCVCPSSVRRRGHDCRPAKPSGEPLHLVIFVRLVGRCSQDATGTLRVEDDQPATVLARRVPLLPLLADQGVAIEEDGGLLVRERLQLF